MGSAEFELGFERTGCFRTRWFVEWDPYAQAVLRKRFPNTTVYADITTIDFSTVQKVDILTGGFPCQDISNAGKRIGITGGRSGLWKEYTRAIREIRPQYAVIENVAALVGRGLNVVLSDLAEIGYDSEWYNLSASAVGAPHRRERIFIIAYPNEQGRQGERQDTIRSPERSNTIVSHANGIRLEEQESKQRLYAWKQEISHATDTNIERCDDGCDHREGRYVLPNEGIAEEGEQEREGWESRIGKIYAGIPDTDEGGLSKTRTEQFTTGTSRSYTQVANVADTKIKRTMNVRKNIGSGSGKIDTSFNTSCIGRRNDRY